MPKKAAERFAVIMAGGRGERFWPLSRESRPKQLLPLLGNQTLLEQTVARLKGVVPERNVWIITNRKHVAAIRRVLPKIPARQIIAEPVGRDSAGAVLLGAAFVGQKHPDALLAFLPADQHIARALDYRKALGAAFDAAESEECVVTIGQKPSSPHTGYGYVEAEEAKTGPARRALRFREKPPIDEARQMVDSGRFYWNLGIFVWSIPTLRRAFAASPAHAAGLEAALKNPDKYLRGPFAKLPKISIDYAVIEKMRNIRVVPGDFGWDDIGSWSALFQHLPADPSGNLFLGEVASLEASGCLAWGAAKKTIALLGVRDLLVVETPDALLVCDRSRAQELKKLVEKLPKKLR